MLKAHKNQQVILNKFNITELNPMQKEASEAILSDSDIVLLSPTGTGKTLAFLLPIVASLDEKSQEVQTLIVVPSRELAIQIEQVTRKMGTGFKINAVYGGRAGSLDKIDLKHRPAILIGTPGRIADRFRRDRFSLENITTLVLDEFDKSLEMGFKEEMTEIIEALSNVKKRVLTSATHEVKIPEFVGLQNVTYLNYLDEGTSLLTVKTILSPDKDKLETLEQTLVHIGNQPGIIFCSFKDALQRVSDFLTDKQINHGCFHGGMDQPERERTLIKFRNGTHRLLIATDLAARGLDIPEIRFIIHYHLPTRYKEFTHRNGRTARMNSNGVAYILHWEKEEYPEYILENQPIVLHAKDLTKTHLPSLTKWKTLYISGGRRDKISKGDIAGLFIKQGQLSKEQLGIIELKHNCAFAGVHESAAKQLIQRINNTKLKKKKVRIEEV